MAELNVLTTYKIETCCKCGITFAFTGRHYDDLNRTGETFYCPSGHPQHYVDTDAAKHKRELDELNRKLANREWELSMANSANRSTRIQLTKAKNKLKSVETRTANGACTLCNRQFSNLQRHMNSKHAEHVTQHGNKKGNLKG